MIIKRQYEKNQSFEAFRSLLKSDMPFQKGRVIKVLSAINKDKLNNVLISALKDLNDSGKASLFKINQYISDELSRIEDKEIARYICHRYRYDVYPKIKGLDEFPPYLQIEPASVCNYRCVFCYQTDKSFNSAKSGYMGFMSFSLFKKIIGQIEGNIEFLSIASRGEPMLCPDVNKMLLFCRGKFLGLKLNTNGSKLSEENCHAILSGGVNTVVFSVDAVDKKSYEKFRVNGDFEKVLNNIKLFKKIKKSDYPKSKIITRISGVSFSKDQNIDAMS
ncbi:MAG: radical SAM protein, partial [Candidatus Omnitrophica bacterium]|nr:radical SAM protein [Candidatus Omnitrophota bacterium]